jgi:acetyltransferase
MSSGAAVLLRPIRPEDEPLEYEMLSTMSEESRKLRFFVDIKNITHEMLTRFCNIDYDREMAFVAEVGAGDDRRIIGISRLIIDSDFKTGEFAVAVHDSYQGMGLGHKLIDLIIGIAIEKGLDTIYATVLSINYRMLRIGQKMGFTTSDVSDGTVQISLQLK